LCLWGSAIPGLALRRIASQSRGLNANKLNAQQVAALALVAHAFFADLCAYWLYINIWVILVAICSWPFWWAILGYRQMRVRLVVWSLVAATAVYVPSLRVVEMMLKGGG
jgi:hypothetical protein